MDYKAPYLFTHQAFIATRAAYSHAKEMGKISVAIVNDRGGRQCGSEKQGRTLLAKTVEQEEERIMRALRAKMESHGWRVSSLIHDAIIVEKKNEVQERAKLHDLTQQAMDEISEEMEWGRGILKVKITPT